MEKKYVKNISQNELTIPNVGVVQAGQVVLVPSDFNNPNFEVVTSESKDEPKEAPKSFNKNKVK